MQGGPAGCGLERANWTYAELATQLYRSHGITVGETAMREFCHRHDIRPYRPSYRFLRADPARRRRRGKSWRH
ncbi:winged helix-turn-helix domain-containing protein [uncultured Halomonas sp.]|uniref:winged helix-turn-helix domain-containing protein n=1 Tax=uncultured Halomonas sp. TaxID=173971 RepID=UPI001BCBC2A0|nr:winged helix-turn-helix domain-containing protein [Gammaproteobacteria bacterium]